MNIYSENYKVKRIKSLIEQAQSSGGVLEVKKVLFEAMAALSHVVDGHQINKAQIESLKFVHDSLSEFLMSDKPLEAAFFLDKKAGRPKSDVHGEDVFYVLKIDEEVSKQIKLTGQPNIKTSLNRAASKFDENVSSARLKQAWERLGSLKGYKSRNEDAKS